MSIFSVKDCREVNMIGNNVAENDHFQVKIEETVDNDIMYINQLRANKKRMCNETENNTHNSISIQQACEQIAACANIGNF